MRTHTCIHPFYQTCVPRKTILVNRRTKAQVGDTDFFGIALATNFFQSLPNAKEKQEQTFVASGFSRSTPKKPSRSSLESDGGESQCRLSFCERLCISPTLCVGSSTSQLRQRQTTCGEPNRAARQERSARVSRSWKQRSDCCAIEESQRSRQSLCVSATGATQISGNHTEKQVTIKAKNFTLCQYRGERQTSGLTSLCSLSTKEIQRKKFFESFLFVGVQKMFINDELDKFACGPLCPLRQCR